MGSTLLKNELVLFIEETLRDVGQEVDYNKA